MTDHYWRQEPADKKGYDYSSKTISECGPDYSHPRAYAVMNSARLRWMIMTTHQGNAKVMQMTDSHSTPRRSEYHPARGAAAMN
jgi:hypothetical protein